MVIQSYGQIYEPWGDYKECRIEQTTACSQYLGFGISFLTPRTAIWGQATCSSSPIYPGLLLLVAEAEHSDNYCRHNLQKKKVKKSKVLMHSKTAMIDFDPALM